MTTTDHDFDCDCCLICGDCGDVCLCDPQDVFLPSVSGPRRDLARDWAAATTALAATTDAVKQWAGIPHDWGHGRADTDRVDAGLLAIRQMDKAMADLSKLRAALAVAVNTPRD